MLKSAKLAIAKVPSNDMEALKSNLMGLFEKKRLMNFYKYLENVDLEDKKTWKDVDLTTAKMQDMYKKYKLEENTIDFLGHAVALHIDDAYLQQPAADTMGKMQLYLDSIGRYGDSPFLYPIYGLGGLPEAFSRLCAIHGGTYMLNTQVDEILMEDGKVKGIRSGDKTATAPLVICDPSYCSDQFKKPIGKVIRAICLLNHPIPNTNNAPSIQIILPAKQLGKRTDTYISMVSYSHLICAKGIYVAIISATVETDHPEQEIQPAVGLLGDILEMFVSVSNVYESNSPVGNNLWVTSSYDATSHFETASEEIL